MSIRDITIKDGIATLPTFSGNERHFCSDGAQVANGIHLVDINETVYLDRAQMTLKCRPAVLNVKTGALTKQKQSVSIAFPFRESETAPVLFNTIRLELECHPNSTGSNAELRDLLVSFLTNANTSAFFIRGDIS